MDVGKIRHSGVRKPLDRERHLNPIRGLREGGCATRAGATHGFELDLGSSAALDGCLLDGALLFRLLDGRLLPATCQEK